MRFDWIYSVFSIVFIHERGAQRSHLPRQTMSDAHPRSWCVLGACGVHGSVHGSACGARGLVLGAHVRVVRAVGRVLGDPGRVLCLDADFRKCQNGSTEKQTKYKNTQGNQNINIPEGFTQ